MSNNTAPSTLRSPAEPEDGVNCWIIVRIASSINVSLTRLPDTVERLTAFLSELSAAVHEFADEDPKRTLVLWSEDIALGSGEGPVRAASARPQALPWPTIVGGRQVWRFRHAPDHRRTSIERLEEVLYAELSYLRNRLSHCAEVRGREGGLVAVEIDLSSIEVVDDVMESLLSPGEIDVVIDQFAEAQNDTSADR